MAIARIENDSVSELRDHLSLEAVPEHKRAAWLPVEGEAPNADPRFHMMAGPQFQIEANRVLRVWTVTVRDLATVKSESKARIDREAEAARLQYITDGAGQALEYQEAAEEAVRYAATGGAGAYPMLQASVDAGEAADLAAAAALITSRENAWATIGANIRRLRLTAKRGIEAATTVEQVQAAATVTWPCP